MICEKCKNKKLTSKVFTGIGTTTLLWNEPYYDEEGKYHKHDSNIRTYKYHCSNGHYWSIKSLKRCSNCDYGKNSEEINYYE